jgi:hypothetical protein
VLGRGRLEQRAPDLRLDVPRQQRSEDAEDPALPFMIWYGLEPLVKSDLARASKLAGETKIPFLRTSIARRIASGN